MKTFTCKNDATHTKTEAIDATGHDHEAVVTAPTCEAAGYTTYTCACGDTYTADEVDALGHDWDEGEVTTEPTCEDEGVKTFTCKNDAAHTKTEAIDATGHAYGNCTKLNDEQHQKVCANDENHVLTEDHDWNGTVTTEPTYATAGEKTYTCAENCGVASYTEPVAKLPFVIINRFGTAAEAQAALENGTYEKADGTSGTWYEFAAVVNGVETTVKVDSASITGSGTMDKRVPLYNSALYSVYTTGGEDYYTFTDTVEQSASYQTASTKCGFRYDGENEQGIPELTAGITNGGSKVTYKLADDVIIVRALDQHTVTVLSLADMEAYNEDADDHLWVYKMNSDDLIDFVIIQKKSEDRCPGEAHTWPATGTVTTQPTYTSEGVRTYTCSACGATKTETVAKAKAVALFVPPHASGASASIKANPNTTEYNGETYYQYPAMVDGEAKMIWVAETSIWSDKTADTLGVTGSWIMWFTNYTADGEYYTVSSQAADSTFVYSGFGSTSAGQKYDATTKQIQFGQDSYSGKKTFTLDDSAVIVRFGGGTGSKTTAYTPETLPADANNPDYVRAYNFGGDDTVDVIVLYGR
ncbi:MAG: hypothetical protein E7443_00740 [Ruminococcaceae bacterium]|nr:hypothetical protein [Oscillospiraceae bacterium]